MAYEPTRLQLARQRLAKAYQALRGRDANRRDQSTAAGYLHDPDQDRYNRKWAEPIEHDALVEELQTILNDHPVVRAGLSKLCDVGKFTITAKSSIYGEQETARANRILQRTKKNCQLDKKTPVIAKRAVGLGDGYLQVETDQQTGKEILDAILMPNVGMVRNTNHLDRFMPGKPCFIQRTANLTHPVEFYEGQIIHGRWDHEDGQRNGTSVFFAGRSASKDSLAALRSLLPRRLANQPFRVFNVSPGKGIMFSLFQKIKESLSRLVWIQKGGQVSPFDDVFVNNIEVDVKGGEDSKGGDYKDIELLLDLILMMMGVSRQILGAGTNVNRDVMDEQREELYKFRRRVVEFLKDEFLHPLFDLALQLEGFAPGAVDYTIDFADEHTDSRMERKIDKIIALHKEGMIAIEDAFPVFAPYCNIENVQEAIDRVKSKPKPAPVQPPQLAQQPQQQQPQLPPAPQPQPADDAGDDDLMVN